MLTVFNLGLEKLISCFGESPLKKIAVSKWYIQDIFDKIL
jgi:hypothetical protein